MKKLIIAAAAVAMGVVANAASVSWGTESDTIYASDGSGSAGEGYAVYFLTAVDYAYASAVEDIANGNFDFVSNAREGSAGTVVYAESDGYAANTDVGFKAGYSAPLETKAYLVVFDAETVAEAKNVYISEALDLSINDLGGSDPLDFDMGATKSDTAWTAVSAAPEPTSGLLLLLGVAGLALRRRRA